jgi:hypothetical protein
MFDHPIIYEIDTWIHLPASLTLRLHRADGEAFARINWVNWNAAGSLAISSSRSRDSRSEPIGFTQVNGCRNADGRAASCQRVA